MALVVSSSKYLVPDFHPLCGGWVLRGKARCQMGGVVGNYRVLKGLVSLRWQRRRLRRFTPATKPHAHSLSLSYRSLLATLDASNSVRFFIRRFPRAAACRPSFFNYLTILDLKKIEKYIKIFSSEFTLIKGRTGTSFWFWHCPDCGPLVRLQ